MRRNKSGYHPYPEGASTRITVRQVAFLEGSAHALRGGREFRLALLAPHRTVFTSLGPHGLVEWQEWPGATVWGPSLPATRVPWSSLLLEWIGKDGCML